MSDLNEINIPPNHKRSLSVTAHHIEKSINDIESILNNNQPSYSLTGNIIKNMDEETRKEILKLTQIVGKKNKEMF